MELSLIKQSLDSQLISKLQTLLSPGTLGKIANKAPRTINHKLVSFLLNQAFNEQVNDGDFEFLLQKILLVEIIDANTYIGISFRHGRLICTHFGSVEVESDAMLSLSTYDAIQLVEQSVDPDTLFFQRKLKIHGNTEIAHQAKNTIDTLDQSRIPSFLLSLASSYKTNIISTSG